MQKITLFFLVSALISVSSCLEATKKTIKAAEKPDPLTLLRVLEEQCRDEKKIRRAAWLDKKKHEAKLRDPKRKPK